MSGGSMNYLYSRVEMEAVFNTNTPERRAFAKHIEKVIKALHDIEWVDSCDYGPGDENKAIMDCISPALLVEAAIENAKQAQKELAIAIAKAKEMN